MKKKILSFMFVICICLNLLAVSPLSVFAEESGTCGDNLTWTLSGNTLTISGTGDMYDYNSDTDVPWYQIKDDIYYLVIDSGVTSIGNYAFYQVNNITDVTIPTGVKSIGNYAFYECSKLKNIIGADGVVSIGESAFSYCSSLESISIPAGVTSIADSAFIWCGNLNISVDDNNEYYSSLDGVLFNKYKTTLIKYTKDAIQPEYIIPNSVTAIGVGAFNGCTKLISVKIPDSVTSIGKIAFQSCFYLKQVSIPRGVTSIEDLTFNGCNGLENVLIPNTIKSIGRGAFGYCYSLKDIIIPDSVTTIGIEPFIRCGSLSISVDEKNEYFSSFNGVLFNKDKTELVAYANDKIESEFTIPYGVKSIGYLAFIECVYMTSITIPDSVTFIDKYAFFSCYVLSDVYYTGTQEQWEQISIGKNNTYLQNATIHYNCSSEQSRPVCQINGAVASADKMTVYVSSSLGAVNNTMLIAKYKSGILIGLNEKQIDLSADSNEVVFENFAKGNADTIKIMLWSRTEPFKPLCGEYTIL